MTASRSTGPVLHRNGASHRYAKSGPASAIIMTGLEATREFRQPIVTSHLRLFSAISNRYTKLLEILVSYTKHKVDTHSNRYKKRFSPRPSLSSPTRLAFVGPERSYRAEGVRSTPLVVALVPNFAETKRACASLIANEMHSPQLATNSKRATYDFLIANEFQFAKRVRLSHV
jgi:hypothetical protein